MHEIVILETLPPAPPEKKILTQVITADNVTAP